MLNWVDWFRMFRTVLLNPPNGDSRTTLTYRLILCSYSRKCDILWCVNISNYYKYHVTTPKRLCPNALDTVRIARLS